MLAEAIAHYLEIAVLSYPSFAPSTQKLLRPFCQMQADFTIVNNAS